MVPAYMYIVRILDLVMNNSFEACLLNEVPKSDSVGQYQSDLDTYHH